MQDNVAENFPMDIDTDAAVDSVKLENETSATLPETEVCKPKEASSDQIASNGNSSQSQDAFDSLADFDCEDDGPLLCSGANRERRNRELDGEALSSEANENAKGSEVVAGEFYCS